MPYADPWDETTPADTDWAEQGDDKIRELKRAIGERLTTVLDNWPDGDFMIKSGVIPAGVTDGVLATGTKAALPNPAATLFYYATDTKELFVRVSNTFVVVNAGSGSPPIVPVYEAAMADYDATQPVGSKSAGQFYGVRAVCVRWSGNVAAGLASLVLSEIGLSSVNYIYGMAAYHVDLAPLKQLEVYLGSPMVPADPTLAYVPIYVYQAWDNLAYTGAATIMLLIYTQD